MTDDKAKCHVALNKPLMVCQESQTPDETLLVIINDCLLLMSCYSVARHGCAFAILSESEACTSSIALLNTIQDYCTGQ